MAALFGIGMWVPGQDEIARRLYDLITSMRDFDIDLEELVPELDGGDKWSRTTFTSEHGYQFHLELRQRGSALEYGFTLVQTGRGLHSAVIRLRRRMGACEWNGVAFHPESATAGMQRLMNAYGFRASGERLRFADLSVNGIFGGCCRLYLDGFL